MKPQEIFEYKMRWAPGFMVHVHSDLDWKAKDWCRRNLERHKWKMDAYTDVYQHTFMFEHEHDAKLFADQFNEKLVERTK